MRIKQLLFLCAAFGLASVATGKWVDLFAFPFTKAPMEIMMGLACPNTSVCFFTGSHGNDPFGVYYTKDEFKSTSEDVMKGSSMLSMALAFSTETNGVAAGVGALKDSACMYTLDSVNWLDSSDQALAAGQDVETIAPHAFGFVGTTSALLNKNGVLYTNDGGASWKAEDWQKGLLVPEGTSPRYGAFPTHTTWYVTGGSWPSSSTEKIGHHQFTRVYSLDKNRKLHIDLPTADVSAAPFNGYAAVIVKTTDAGKTWELQYNGTNEFYFNDINCFNESLCTAVAEGFTDGTSPGGRIFGSNDGGKTWKQQYFTNAPNAGMMMVRMLSATEIWVAGGQAPSQLKAQVLFYHSTDGGKTWETHDDLVGPAMVVGWSFPSNSLAFATAITSVSDSTILKYTSA